MPPAEVQTADLQDRAQAALKAMLRADGAQRPNRTAGGCQTCAWRNAPGRRSARPGAEAEEAEAAAEARAHQHAEQAAHQKTAHQAAGGNRRGHPDVRWVC